MGRPRDVLHSRRHGTLDPRSPAGPPRRSLLHHLPRTRVGRARVARRPRHGARLPRRGLGRHRGGLPPDRPGAIPHVPAGPVLTPDIWGGYLILEWPQVLVYVDGRWDLRDDEFFQRYAAIILALPGWERGLKEEGVNLALLPLHGRL